MGYFDALLRYFEFWGRTSRAQYWTYQLLMLVAVVAGFFADVGAIRLGIRDGGIAPSVAFAQLDENCACGESCYDGTIVGA